MALSIDKGHTALLAMDFQNDIVHEDGAFKDFGFAAMVEQNDVLKQVCTIARRSPPRGRESHLRRGQVPPRLPRAPSQRRSVAGTSTSECCDGGFVGCGDT